jgi:uncharacterized phage protein gp47/JayE
VSGTSPTAAFVDVTGIHNVPYQTILDYVRAKYASIYGSDVYLENDSQDEQLLAVYALGISDANSLAIAVYNAFSPVTAQGVGLSSNVKINGLARLVPSNGTVNVDIGGQNGTQIFNGIVADPDTNVRWLLPPVVEIDITGLVTVTATAENPGAVSGPAGTITKIVTPSAGWQTVNNPADAVQGLPVEVDGTLRQRQAASTMLPSVTIMDGLIGSLKAVLDVVQVKGYHNPTGSVDSNGLPANSISIVTEGGDAATIAGIIALKKTLGTATYGTTVVTVPDTRGGSDVINYFVAALVPITVIIHLTALAGYVFSDGAAASAAVATAINNNAIGDDVITTTLYGPAYSPNTGTYVINSILIARTGSPGASNVVIAFNELSSCDPLTNVTVVIP